MCRVEVYLGLGTNIGDRKANLDEALDRLDTLLGCHYSALSGFVETDNMAVPASAMDSGVSSAS